jgi:hypothetical protein
MGSSQRSVADPQDLGDDVSRSSVVTPAKLPRDGVPPVVVLRGMTVPDYLLPACAAFAWVTDRMGKRQWRA